MWSFFWIGQLHLSSTCVYGKVCDEDGHIQTCVTTKLDYELPSADTILGSIVNTIRSSMWSLKKKKNMQFDLFQFPNLNSNFRFKMTVANDLVRNFLTGWDKPSFDLNCPFEKKCQWDHTYLTCNLILYKTNTVEGCLFHLYLCQNIISM